MKTKKITSFVCFTLIIAIICCIATPSHASESPTLLEGTYILRSQAIYEQNLGEAYGLCVEGINSIDGQTHSTDLIVSGANGHSSWRALEYWYSNTSTGTPYRQSDHDDTIYDMAKFEASDGNMDLIYLQADTSAGTGYDRIVRQSGIENTFYLSPDWYVNTDSKPIALTVGEFWSGSGVEAAVICEYGEVYIIRDMNSGSNVKITLDEGFTYFHSNHYYRYAKNMIDNIADLDGNNPTYDDVVVGHDQNVTAISNNNSNQVIWTNEVISSGYVCSVLAVDDMNADTYEDVVVSTSSSGLFLLSGFDGTVLQSQSGIGSYLRDVQVYNSTHIITGNSDGNVMVWDCLTGTVDLSADFTYDVKVIMSVGDINSDGYDEFAVGGVYRVGVYNGNNMTLRWSDVPRGQAWLAPDNIIVYDLCMMEDMVNDYGTIGATDGVGELGVIGFYGDAGYDSAMFIYNTYGAWQFIPDLSGSGTIDSNCEENSNYEFTFTATVYQRKGLDVSAEISIDDGAWISMTQGAGTPVTGVSFSYSQGGFSDGDHTYKFRFTDTFPDEVIRGNYTFQVGGDCGGGGGGLDIPGAGVWMILSSIGVATIILLISVKKYRQ